MAELAEAIVSEFLIQGSKVLLGIEPSTSGLQAVVLTTRPACLVPVSRGEGCKSKNPIQSINQSVRQLVNH